MWENRKLQTSDGKTPIANLEQAGIRTTDPPQPLLLYTTTVYRETFDQLKFRP